MPIPVDPPADDKLAASARFGQPLVRLLHHPGFGCFSARNGDLRQTRAFRRKRPSLSIERAQARERTLQTSQWKQCRTYQERRLQWNIMLK